LIAALLIACGVLAFVVLRSPASRKTELSVVFLGLTNNPGPAVVGQFASFSTGTGIHASFLFSNQSADQTNDFGVESVELWNGQSWSNYARPKNFYETLGSVWPPGHEYKFLIPWPTNVAMTKEWRLKLWEEPTRREPSMAARINFFLGRDVLSLPVRYYTTSPVVKLNLPEVSGLATGHGTIQQSASPEPPPRVSSLEAHD
jgi:hypothetical protein